MNLNMKMLKVIDWVCVVNDQIYTTFRFAWLRIKFCKVETFVNPTISHIVMTIYRTIQNMMSIFVSHQIFLPPPLPFLRFLIWLLLHQLTQTNWIILKYIAKFKIEMTLLLRQFHQWKMCQVPPPVYEVIIYNEWDLSER